MRPHAKGLWALVVGTNGVKYHRQPRETSHNMRAVRGFVAVSLDALASSSRTTPSAACAAPGETPVEGGNDPRSSRPAVQSCKHRGPAHRRTSLGGIAASPRGSSARNRYGPSTSWCRPDAARTVSDQGRSSVRSRARSCFRDPPSPLAGRCSSTPVRSSLRSLLQGEQSDEATPRPTRAARAAAPAGNPYYMGIRPKGDVTPFCPTCRCSPGNSPR
jgi:hypothetical protein